MNPWKARVILILMCILVLAGGCKGSGAGSGCEPNHPDWLAAVRELVTEAGGQNPTEDIVAEWEALAQANLSPEREGSALQRERDARAAVRRGLEIWGVPAEVAAVTAERVVNAYQRELCGGLSDAVE